MTWRGGSRTDADRDAALAAAPPEHLAGYQPWLPPDRDHRVEHAGNDDRGLPDPPGAALTDPRLIGGIADITAMIAARLDDGATAARPPAPVAVPDGARRQVAADCRP